MNGVWRESRRDHRTSPPMENIMRTHALSHLGDRELLKSLRDLVSQGRVNTAAVLAHLVEVDTRKLFVKEGYPTLYAYCLQGLGLSEDSAFKRIRAARAARDFPVILEAVAEGRLHLSAIVLLAPHLHEDGGDELLAAAEHKTKTQIEALLAWRFPREDVPTRVTPVPAPAPELLTEPVAPGPVDVPTSRPKVTPLAPQRFALQLTMSQE